MPIDLPFLHPELAGLYLVRMKGFAMRFILSLTVVILTANLPQVVSAQTSDETQSEVVKQLAQQLASATQKGDYKKIVSLSYEKVVEQLGGPAKAFETVKEQMDMMKQRGMKMTQYSVGKLSAFASTPQNKFVIVPTQMTFTLPGVTVKADSFLLGISPDQGKTWRFVDGAGIATAEDQKKVLPTLPDKFRLPKPKQPKILRD